MVLWIQCDQLSQVSIAPARSAALMPQQLKAFLKHFCQVFYHNHQNMSELPGGWGVGCGSLKV